MHYILDIAAIFAPLIIGYLFKLKSDTIITIVNKLCRHLVSVILTILGLSLASIDNLWQQLPIIFSYTIIPYFLLLIINMAGLFCIDKFYPLKTAAKKSDQPFFKLLILSFKPLMFVFTGLILGLFLRNYIHLDHHFISKCNYWALLLLLFFVGVQLRNSGMTFAQIMLNKRGFILSIVIFTTSLLAGLLAQLFLELPFKHTLALTSGYGCSSISAILVGNSIGPILGSAAFLNDLLRQLTAVVLIPMLMRRFPNMAIGYAAAIAMDFTLPVIQDNGGIEVVPVAIVTGMLLTLYAPLMLVILLG